MGRRRENVPMVQPDAGLIAKVKKTHFPLFGTYESFGRDKGFRGNFKKVYTDLRACKPVRREFMEAFLELIQPYGIPFDPPGYEELGYIHPEDGDTWIDVYGFLRACARPFRDKRNNMYLLNPAVDVPLFARSVMAHVGRTNPGNQGIESEIERAEAVMLRSKHQNTEWLRGIHATDKRSLMYTLDSKYRRISVSVGFATTPDVARRVCAVEMLDAEIRPGDVLRHGRHFHLNALFSVEGSPDVAESARLSAEAQCVAYQAAYFFRKLERSNPFIYMMAGNKHIERRLHKMGYRPTGACLKGTDKPIVALGKLEDCPSSRFFGKRLRGPDTTSETNWEAACPRGFVRATKRALPHDRRGTAGARVVTRGC